MRTNSLYITCHGGEEPYVLTMLIIIFEERGCFYVCFYSIVLLLAFFEKRKSYHFRN